MTRYIIFGLSLVSVLAFWRIDHISASLDTATQRVRELEASNESRKNTIRLLGDLDTQHTQEREHANQVNAGLRADVAAGKRRLSVLATSCTATGSATAAGVGHAEARAELDPAAAERIVRIANDGDDAIRALTGLQDYINKACIGAAQ